MMLMGAYYNDNDPKICSWLRELIKEGLIAAGEVDERSIKEISADDLKGFVQHHFFAGIGGWSYALRLASWPDDQPVWTGSCPCQPFSSAGRGLAEKDPRHLWPYWFQLISEYQPATIFGEQVASKRGRKWLSGVRTDWETLGYAVGAADLCAASVGSPQIRQRLWWVGYTNSEGFQKRASNGRVQQEALGSRPGEAPECPSPLGGLSDSHEKRSVQEQHGTVEERSSTQSLPTRKLSTRTTRCGSDGGLFNAERGGRQAGSSIAEAQPPEAQLGKGYIAGPRNNPWDEYDVLEFADGKARRVEPGTFPLAHGVPARVLRLRGYGNAINPQTAAIFIRAMRGI